MNEFSFLRILRESNHEAIRDSDAIALKHFMQSRLLGLVDQDVFKKSSIDSINQVSSLLVQDHSLLEKAFPGVDHEYFTRAVEEYSPKNTLLDVDKFFDNGVIFLTKSDQIGQTTMEEISPAINEYERLAKAGFASPAEILTLSRYYPESLAYQKMAAKLPDQEPVVVGGPASVEMVDKEGHLITMEAMKRAFTKFMVNHRTRNIMVLHSDVQTGWALPAYINKAGQIFKSGVDDSKFFLVSELRSDNPVSKRVIEQVQDGKIRSYSIAGSVLSKEESTQNGQPITKVTDLSLIEITLCERGVNQGAHFDILKSTQPATTSCVDGSCLTKGVDSVEGGRLQAFNAGKFMPASAIRQTSISPQDPSRALRAAYTKILRRHRGKGGYRSMISKAKKLMPPRPGMRFDYLKHRWVRPRNEEKERAREEDERGREVSKAISDLETWAYLQKQETKKIDPSKTLSGILSRFKDRQTHGDKINDRLIQMQPSKSKTERKYRNDPSGPPLFSSGSKDEGCCE